MSGRSGEELAGDPDALVEVVGEVAALLVLEERGERGVEQAREHADGDRVVVATLAPDFLWGLASEMSQDMRICLYAVRERLFCGGHPGTDPGERLVSEHWDLFLKAGFDAPQDPTDD